MTPKTWQRLRQLFEQAVELEPEERRLWLDDLRREEPDLARELEAMLEVDEEGAGVGTGGTSLEQAVWRVAGDAMEDRTPASPSEPTPSKPEEATRLGPYLLERPLGRGGMATVHRARRADGTYEQLVAIKILKTVTHQVIQRFRTERQILAQLDHPNIVRLLDGGETSGGIPYAVLEYVEGEPIHRFCERRGLSLARRLELFRAVCSAVHHAHRHGIVHRDLKPANILVTPDRVPKVLDFGIAKAMEDAHLPGGMARTEPGMRLLTPAYASPEQQRGEAVTPATDLYALGLMLLTLLTRERPPSARDTSPEERLDIARKQLRQAAIPNWLARVVEKALAPVPADRHVSAQAMADALLPSLHSGGTRIKVGATLVAVLASLLALIWLVPWQKSSTPTVEALTTLAERRAELNAERARPVHDIRPARDRLSQAMIAVEELLDYLEPSLRALALAELGGAHLVLGALEPAREQLLAAQKAGRWGDDLDRNLALVLGRQELEAAAREPLSEPLASVAAASSGSGSSGALRRSLEIGGHESGVGAYIRALLAALEEGTDAVRLHAAMALGTAWEAEAQLLEGFVFERRRDQRQASGDVAAAMKDHAAAAKAYGAATRAAPSDPRGHLRLCLMGLEAEACQRAVDINPDDPAAQAALSRLVTINAVGTGKD